MFVSKLKNNGLSVSDVWFLELRNLGGKVSTLVQLFVYLIQKSC